MICDWSEACLKNIFFYGSSHLDGRSAVLPGVTPCCCYDQCDGCWWPGCDVWRVTRCTLLHHKQVTVPSVCSPRWIFKRRFPKITKRFQGGLLLVENAMFIVFVLCLNSVFNVKALVGDFNYQGLLHDCKTSGNLRLKLSAQCLQSPGVVLSLLVSAVQTVTGGSWLSCHWYHHSLSYLQRYSVSGAKKLVEKIKEYNPKIAVFNGKGIYEVFSGEKEFIFGKQPQKIADTDTVNYLSLKLWRISRS